MMNRLNAPRWLKNVYNFYKDGFKNMTVGRTLWVVVLIKLFIMFAVLKVFFFPNFLDSKFKQEKEKADFVNSELIERSTATFTDSISDH